MEIRTEETPANAIIYVKGEIDIYSSPDLRAAMAGFVKKHKTMIVIEMSEVKYLDSSGVATMVECLQGVRRYHGILRLCGLRNTVKDVFALARLDQVFDLREDLKSALE